MLRSRSAGLILQVLLSGGTYRHTFGKYDLFNGRSALKLDEYLHNQINVPSASSETTVQLRGFPCGYIGRLYELRHCPQIKR
jgi:hypothetical protein